MHTFVPAAVKARGVPSHQPPQRKGATMPEALWQVQENARGCWRDFPQGLATQTEEQFQLWLAAGVGGGAFSYVYHNSKASEYTTYVILFPENMIANEELASMTQMNTRTQKVRNVRRIPYTRPLP